METTFDVIVVGLGAMGSAAVYQLARPGVRVLGIDRFSPPHTYGSSHGDTRIIRQAIGEGLQYVPLVLRAYDLWREIEAAAGTSLLTVTGELILSGPGSGASRRGKAGFFHRTVEAARTYGIPHELLDARQVQARFPQFDLVGDETGYFEPGAGFLRPERCGAAQLRLAERHGAELHRDEVVAGYRSAGTAAGGVTVTTDRGEYSGRRLIVTMGAWLPVLLDPGIARLFAIYRQVLHWFRLRDSDAAYAPGRFPVFIWEFSDGSGRSMYGFPAIDGPNGGLKVATAQYERTTTAATVQRDVMPDESRAMYDQCVLGRLPGLLGTCVKARSCLYTVTPDGQFIIDRHPHQPNVILASPCSGHGFKHSAAIGEALADLALDQEPRVDLRPFSLARFAGAQ